MERWEFGDPQIVAIKREQKRLDMEKACGSCIHRLVIDFEGEQFASCEVKKRTYGNRCKSYMKRKNKNGK